MGARVGRALNALDRGESALARATAFLARPGPFYAAAAAIVALAFLVRLPLAATATDVCCGHPDSWVYFHQAYVEYLKGNFFPDAHRGSGWQLLLFATLDLLGYEPGTHWSGYYEPMTGEAAQAALVAHTLSATLSVGAVAATLLLARELLPRAAALLAATLVAFDPFLLRSSTSAMSEPVYVPLFVLATLTVLRARRHPAWLVATGALMALAHVLRVNGLVMFVALLVYAFLLLRNEAATTRQRDLSFTRRVVASSRQLLRERRLIAWGAASVATFLLVASPYLVWRASELPHAFDYGTNQRFWADDLWDMDDAWWTARNAGAEAPRETMRDYFAEHGVADAAVRLWQSIAWQVFDLVGSGRYPPWVVEGGSWVGSPQEESALTPLVAGLALVAAFTAMKGREWWFLPVALGFTFLTFLWIYPLVRSVRYFAALIPLFTIAAIAGWLHLATHVSRPRLVGAAVFGSYLLLYAPPPLVHVGKGLDLLATSSDARALVLVTGLLWMLVVLTPALDGALRWARGARVGRRSADEAP